MENIVEHEKDDLTDKHKLNDNGHCGHISPTILTGQYLAIKK